MEYGYRTDRHVTQHGGICSLESIHGLLKSLKIRALAGRYDNSIPSRFLAPIGCSEILAQWAKRSLSPRDIVVLESTPMMKNMALCVSQLMEAGQWEGNSLYNALEWSTLQLIASQYNPAIPLTEVQIRHPPCTPSMYNCTCTVLCKKEHSRTRNCEDNKSNQAT